MSNHGMERLEERVLLFAWSAEEVYMLELLNRARADPAAEAIRIDFDLTEGLTAGELARYGPQEPLALNEFLTLAAREHTLDMAVRDFFSHDNPDGEDADARATRHGYGGSAGENIAAGYVDIDVTHAAWLESIGHRRNALSLWTSFTDSFHYDEFGAGWMEPAPGEYSYRTYGTHNFGYPTGGKSFVLGVVHDDTNSNDFYDIGEGVGNVRIDVALSSAPETVVGTYTTDDAGNYQIELDPGAYDITFTNTGNGLTYATTVTIDDVNVKVDATLDQLATSIPVNATSDDAWGIGGSARSDGTLTTTARNTDGNPVVFQQSGGEWNAVDLATLLGDVTLVGDVDTFTDGRSGLTYAAAPTTDGLMLYRESEGSWTRRNLTEEITGAGAIASELTIFLSTDGDARIAGLDGSGNLVMYTRTTDTNGDGLPVWIFTDLADALESQGLTQPVFTGELISYTTSWNGQNIAGLDGDGRIQVVWWAPGLDDWQTSDLSEITGAPALTGGLTAYLTSWSGINLAGVDASGELVVTWWVPAFEGDWETSNLTDLFDGPALAGPSTTSYVTPWGGLNVAGLREDGELVVYWWAPGLEAWSVTNLSELIDGAELPTSALSGVASPTGTINLYGVSGDGDVLRYWWQPGDAWILQNLTEAV